MKSHTRVMNGGFCTMTIPPYCPAVGRNPMNEPETPTYMTEDGFKRTCQAQRRLVAKKMGPRYASCGQCKGETVPKGIIFKTVEEFMAGKKEAKCACCGESKMLARNYEKMVCSVCANMRMMAKLKPELVIAALDEFGNIPGTGRPGTRPMDLENEVAMLKKEVAKARELATKAEMARDEARQNYQELKDKTEARQKTKDLAWRLAKGMISGQVKGIDLSDLETLHSLKVAA